MPLMTDPPANATTTSGLSGGEIRDSVVQTVSLAGFDRSDGGVLLAAARAVAAGRCWERAGEAGGLGPGGTP